jgi:hypothetical protein
MPKFLKKLLYPVGWLTNSWEFILSSLSPDNSVTKEETCRVNLGERGPQNRFLTAVAKVAA